MIKAKVYNLEGAETGEMELSEEIFGVEMKDDLVHQAFVAQISNSRQVLADTKDRGEVRGGGKKPWKQKGTGRSRHGSIRSPLWKGGGVVFGPTSDRNYSKKINKKMKAKALFMVLSSKVKDNEMIILDDAKLDKVSTKTMSGVLKKLPVKGKILFSLSRKNDQVFKSIKNIPNVSMIASNSLNVADLLKNKTFIIDKKGVEMIEKIYKKNNIK